MAVLEASDLERLRAQPKWCEDCYERSKKHRDPHGCELVKNHPQLRGKPKKRKATR